MEQVEAVRNDKLNKEYLQIVVQDALNLSIIAVDLKVHIREVVTSELNLFITDLLTQIEILEAQIIDKSNDHSQK